MPRIGRIAAVGAFLAGALAVEAVQTASTAVAPSASYGTEAVSTAATAVPGGLLPVAKAYRYRMAGRVRPLLAFWIGKDDVGMARIVWRGDETGDRAYELLVGTDPSYAPRAINRWGFITEQVSGRDGAALAMMSRSEEGSFKDAQASVERSSRSGDFKAMRGRVAGGTATSQVTTVQALGTPTVHDATRMIEQTWIETAGARARAIEIEGNVRPGFLVAVAELVEHTMAAARRSGDPLGQLNGLRVPYVFGRELYELRARSIEIGAEAVLGATTRVVHTGFEIRTAATGARTRFEMSYPVDGAMAGVPLLVAWQPRWWLKVELHLDGDAAARKMATGGAGGSLTGQPGS